MEAGKFIKEKRKSFKAGRLSMAREIVEWVKTHSTYWLENGEYIIGKDGWEAKVKEWLEKK